MADKRIKRDWFLAIADMSGEFEGNPAAFDAAQVYGPFTAAEVTRLAKVDEEAGEFPHASYTVTIFKALRKTEGQMRKLILSVVKQAQAERADQDEELEEEIEYHKGNRGPVR